MHMSILTEQPKEKQNHSTFTFTNKIKTIVHRQLQSKSIIFTTTAENSKFHYYTILDPQRSEFIELYWVVDFLPKIFSLNVTYSTYRTLGIPIVINDLRTTMEVSYWLKVINRNIPCFITFMMNQNNEIAIRFERSIFHSSDKEFLLKSLKSIINKVMESAREEFESILPFLTIPLQMMNKTTKIQNTSTNFDKDLNLNQEFNLIKLKNTFDRYRKNKQKIHELIYEEKNLQKLKKKIQQSTKLLGFDLRVIENCKYTTKEIQRKELLKLISTHSQNLKHYQRKDKRIAHQFQIIKVEGNERKCEVNANSDIYFGKYSYRIFRTIVQQNRLFKSFINNQLLASQQKDIIQERVSYLVKKKATNKLSQKALKNETSFLKLMRNQVCKYIANYFLPVQNTMPVLYLEKYDSSLLGFLAQKRLVTFSTRLDIMVKVLIGLKFITDASICHRDVKPSNIMINNQLDPKIIDFGSTISAYSQRTIMSPSEILCGTEGYYFPYQKCHQKTKQHFSQYQYEAHILFDIYSYAVVMERVFEEQLTEKFHNLPIKDTLTFIIERCKEQNPDNRLTYDEVLCFLMLLQNTLATQRNKTKPLQL